MSGSSPAPAALLPVHPTAAGAPLLDGPDPDRPEAVLRRP
ncbi:hypothetical protein QFZ71_002386 [Streptomyces sp. V2I9]|nr:hypothetical protein [Streptomyces sp. V2I9]